jgi:aryl-alcohol dehydrogenase-like predicted oxidoreductase
MRRRRLGGELEVSEVGLGCMGMSEFYGPADEREAVATIHRALELGIDFLLRPRTCTARSPTSGWCAGP